MTFGNKMKKAALILAALVVVTIASFWFLMLRSHEFISTTQVDRSISIAASAPPITSRSGAAFAIVTGELNGTAKIEIVGNRGRDKEQFEVGPGGFELARGGAENWIPDYGIVYTPITATSGSIYASVYCGDGMKEDDRKLHHEISRRN